MVAALSSSGHLARADLLIAIFTDAVFALVGLRHREFDRARLREALRWLCRGRTPLPMTLGEKFTKNEPICSALHVI